MKVIVIGNGKVGKSLIDKLNKEGHEITVIDKNALKLDEINNSSDVLCVHGDGIDSDILNEANVSNSDLVIAVTNSDEANIVISMLAKNMGSKNVISRIRSKEYLKQSKFIKKDLDIDYAINPELRTAKEIVNQFKLVGDYKIESFSKGRVELISLNLEEENKLIGLKLNEINRKLYLKMLICMVQRDGKTIIPNGDFKLKLHDKINIVISNKELENMKKIIMPSKKNINNSVFIIGAGKLTYYLCKELTKMNYEIKVLDNNLEVCEKLAEAFPSITIINGDANNQEVLEEEGFFNSDTFISLTNNDELNIILSLYAKNRKINKIITKVNHSGYRGLIKEFGLTNVFTPREVIIDKILSFVRSISNVKEKSAISIHRLEGDEVEALEFYVDKDFLYTGISLSELKITEDVIIAGVVRKGEFIIADGKLTILEKDILILIALRKKISKLNDIID